MYTFRKYAYWFVVPALAMAAVFALLPVLYSVVISFLRLDLHYPGMEFAGLANYRAVMSDGRAWLAWINTMLFTVSSVTLELVLGLMLALLLHRRWKGAGPSRSLAMVPWAMPAVAAALLWRWIFHDQFGLLNRLLVQAGALPAPVAFLSFPGFAAAAVVLCEVWKTTPFMAVILLAGLQQVPLELYESSRIDGAGAWQQFRYITLPLIRQAVLIALLFRTMDAVRMFDTVYILTGGGPGNTTETLSQYAYKMMFSYLDMGRGAALAAITFLTAAALSGGYIVWLRRGKP